MQKHRSANRHRLLSLLFLLLGVFAPWAHADAPWGQGKKFALIVGINDYDNDSVADLNFADSDAVLLKQVLVEQGQFPKENIFLLTSDAQGESEKPSLTNIVFRLEWLRDIVGPGDTLVFYFAGHGISIDSETFLLTEEADQRSRGTLMISSLRGNVLNDLLKSAGAQNTLVLLDACRNDPTAGRGEAANTLSPALARGLVFAPLPAAAPELERNTATIFACGEGERSWEWGDKKHGFFTYFLAEALRQGAYDESGHATLQKLVGYLREKVRDTALRETNSPQTPMLRYEGPGADRWVLAQSSALASAPSENGIALQERAQLIARAETAELEAKKSQDKVYVLQAQNDVQGAEKEVLLRQNTLLKSRQDGGNVGLAEQELEFAQDNLRLAKESAQASGQRLAFTEQAHSEASLRLEASELAEQVAIFGAQNSAPNLAELEKKLANLEERVVILDRQKREAVEQALVAEAKLVDMQKQLDAKWAGRSLGKRPTKRIRRADLWRLWDPEIDEATELP